MIPQRCQPSMAPLALNPIFRKLPSGQGFPAFVGEDIVWAACGQVSEGKPCELTIYIDIYIYIISIYTSIWLRPQEKKTLPVVMNSF